MFSNGTFNTLLGHCYIERLYQVRYLTSLNQHNFTENTPTGLHCFAVAKDQDTNIPEAKYPTKITVFSIRRKASFIGSWNTQVEINTFLPSPLMKALYFLHS